ncbi:MAG: Wzt carbohydrate-binding domain-containing protein [Caldilineaceae bacterium]
MKRPQRLLSENARRLLDPEQPTTATDQRAAAPPRRWGSGPLRITNVEMCNASGAATWSFAPLEAVTIRIHYQAIKAVAEPIFSVLIHKLDGHYLWASNTYDQPVAPILQAGAGVLTIAVAGLALTNGRYYLSAAAYPEPDPPHWAYPSDFHEQLYRFQVVSEDVIHGDVVMPTKWTHEAPAVDEVQQTCADLFSYRDHP